MSPIASTYAESFGHTTSASHQQSQPHSQQVASYAHNPNEEERETLERHLRRMRPLRPSSSAGFWAPPIIDEDETPPNMLRPVLKPRAPAPWYNYRTLIRPNRVAVGWRIAQ